MEWPLVLFTSMLSYKLETDFMGFYCFYTYFYNILISAGPLRPPGAEAETLSTVPTELADLLALVYWSYWSSVSQFSVPQFSDLGFWAIW